jgi:MFS family permease
VNAATVAGIRRRFLILVGARWLGPGFLAPLLVLVLRDRGFSLAEVGMLFAVYGVTTAALELPTGGLADALGRRAVLAASAILQLVLFAMLLVATSPIWFAVGFAIGGVSRALDSGPLEAWFVDRTRRIDPEASLRGGLSAGGVVSGVTLAIGSIAGGLIPALTGGGIDLAVWAALGAGVIYLAAIFLLMTEPPGDRHGSIGTAFARVPEVVTAGVRLGVADGSLRLLLGAAVGIGFALSGLELLWQPRFLGLLGDGTAGTGPLGFILAGAFAVAALGSALTPWLTRRLGSDPRRAAFTGQLLMAVAVAGLAFAGQIVVAAAAFMAVYLALGLTKPVADELLHEQVSEEVRTTVLSMRSMTLQGAGMVAGLSLGALADSWGIPTAWILTALVLGATSVFYLKVSVAEPSRRDGRATDVETSVLPLG